MFPKRPIFHKIRFWNWLLSAYVKKHVLFIVLGIMLGVLLGLKGRDLFFLFFPAVEYERIGLIGNYTQNSLPLKIQNLISSGLTKVDENGKITPKIALNYETKDNGKTYVFNLRSNLKWHDNSFFKIQDINYAFKDVTISYENAGRLKFSLKEAFAPFPSLVSQPLFKKGLIGLGEYKVTSMDASGKFLTKLVLEKPRKKILLKFYATDEEGIIGYKLGEIDTLQGVSETDAIINYPHTKIIGNPKYDRYAAVFFNAKDGILQEKSLRQALAYSLQTDFITEKRVISPISPLSWAYNPEVKQYDYNLEQAEKLLGKVVDASSAASLKLRFSVLKPYQKYAAKIAQSWKKIGINVAIDEVVFPPTRFDLLLAAEDIPVDPDQYLFWHSTSRYNLTGYNNKRIDLLLEEGRKTIDQKKRKEIYLDFQKYLLEDLPAIFLYHPLTYTVMRI